jgi:hypothetical protein
MILAITTQNEALFYMVLGIVILLFPRALSVIIGVLMILAGFMYFYPNLHP